MKNKHTYVECHGCKWQLEQNIVPDRDWVKNPCPNCNNTRQVIDPKEILCNMCGECMCPFGTMNEQVPHGLHDAKVQGGYDSYHLMDMTMYTFSFCELCLRKLFNQCKIPPKLKDGSQYDEPTYALDQESYEYRLWCDNGGHHQAYLNKKCNIKKDCPNIAIYTLLHDHNEFTEEALCEEHKDRKYSNSTLTKFIPNILKPFL
jgi:hypothetical protein